VSLAIVVTSLTPLLMTGDPTALASPSVPLLSVPLVCQFVMLFGMRALFGIPIDVKANWVFRHHAPDHSLHAAIAGARMALLLAVVGPAALLAGAIGISLWGARAGGIHLGLTAAFGTVLADTLLLGFRKIPFACTYVPGRSRELWPLYLATFGAYAFGLAAVERAAMGSPVVFGAVCVSTASAIAVLAHLRRLDLRHPPGLTYEGEEPSRAFDGFKLSEGWAAEHPAPGIITGRCSGPAQGQAPFPGV
jgi:hypothetical protein